MALSYLRFRTLNAKFRLSFISVTNGTCTTRKHDVATVESVANLDLATDGARR